MTRRLIAVFTIAVGCLVVGNDIHFAQRTPSPALTIESQTRLVTEYCSGCHNDTAKAGGMTLTAINLAHAEQNAPLAEKMIRKLRAGMMPPPGARRPDAAAIRNFAAALETAVDKAAALNPNPGSRSFQRLSQTEYARSIHDLLGLDIDAAAILPPDSLSDGFDNIAEAQSFSPTVLEGYIRASERVMIEALGDPKAAPTSATFTVSSTTGQMRHVDGAPFGTRGGVSVIHNFPADGEYTFNVRFHAATNGGLIGGRSAGEQIEISINGERVALLDIPSNLSETRGNGLNVKSGRIAVKSGAQRISAAFIQKYSGLVDDLVAPIEYTLADAIGAPQLLQVPHLQEFTISGPFLPTGVSDSPSRSLVFMCRPPAAAKISEERTCAAKIISSLARQAYRRPATSSDVDSLMAFYDRGRKDADFESGIRTALQALLASPQFVFRVEQRPSNIKPGENYLISDLELASRLSYFIWSSAPDELLIASASQKKLHEPVELEKQVRRMLADPRSESLSTRFAAQWLRLSELNNMIPDALMFPNYDRTLSQAMRRETELLFDSVLREDRSVLELLTANYTFVNERLAKHYKIPGVLGNRFRRVELKDDYRRGLLGQGSILTLNSNADRTSPVIRGKWVMEVLMGTPPPPPPPNVPSLEATKPIRDGHTLTVRERMESHRANSACMSCHRMIDPIGLALENFDVTGVWRIKDAGVPIDASTVLFDGTPLDGPASLRKALLNYSDSFIGNLTENLMTYAVGRRMQYYDMPAIRTITRDAAGKDNRFSAFIIGIAKSAPFQMNQAETAAGN